MNRNFTARSMLMTAVLLALAACGLPPDNSVYQTRGTPESLLDVSSEVVSLNTTSAADLEALSTWVARDVPTRAELNCDAGDTYCRKAETMLHKKGVPVTRGTYGAQAVTLVYERVIARDCDPRLRNNRGNYFNTNHAGFGCSVASNMIQHVTDKREFVNPSTLDMPSAARGVSTMQRANAPRPVVKPYSINDSAISQSSSQ